MCSVYDGIMHLASFAELEQRDFAALDQYQILPQALHHVETVDCHSNIGDLHVASPLIRALRPQRLQSSPNIQEDVRQEGMNLLVPAAWWLEHDAPSYYGNLGNQGNKDACLIAQLAPDSMGTLMPMVKKISALEKYRASAICLTMSPLAQSYPYGDVPWRPKGREEIAELKAASTCPLWLSGIASVRDAEIAAEAGVDAIVISNQLGAHLHTPATIDIFPEIFDAVAGMTSILVAGNIRHGLDIFRYLAVGAEAIISYSDRSIWQLLDELRYVMRLTGCATLADISYEAVYVPLFREP